MRRLIEFYKLSPGRSELVDLCNLTAEQITLQNCYKFVVGYGDRNFNKVGKHRLKMFEKVATYYVGEIVPQNEVKFSKLFGTPKDKSKPTMFIRLTNGMFMEIYDTSNVVNPNSEKQAKFADLFTENVCYTE